MKITPIQAINNIKNNLTQKNKYGILKKKEKEEKDISTLITLELEGGKENDKSTCERGQGRN